MIARKCGPTLVVVAIITCAGCSSDGNGNGPSGNGGSNSGSGGSSGNAGSGGSGDAQLHGAIDVQLREAVEQPPSDAVSIVTGRIYDGPVRPVIPLVVEREAGDCQLLVPDIPSCSGGCGSDAVCVQDERCEPYPRAQNVGTMYVTGLDQSDDVALEPFPPSFIYQSRELPYPPCDEGAEVELTADDFGARSTCIAPLVVSKTEVIPVESGEPVALTWEPPEQADLATIRIRLDVSHHGGKKGEIYCAVADTGSFDIPVSLVTALVELGLAGYPSVIMTRLVSAPTSTHPGLTFSVSSTVERDVDTGVESCTSNDDCDTGETCDRENFVCE